MRRFLATALVMSAGFAGCSTSAPQGLTAVPGGTRTIAVAAIESSWGSIAEQLGGEHARVTSIVTNPNADPHDYEPTARDARRIADAALVIVNGLGYDPWAPKLIAADGGGRRVLTVGTLLGLRAGANPHRWYNPAEVRIVIDAIVGEYSVLDPADAAYFGFQRTRYEEESLAGYGALVSAIRTTYAGTPVGASESIFAMLAPALGLRLITPGSFLRAVSEGADVTAADKAAADEQIRNRQIRIYVYNSQNTTPDVQAQLDECRRAGIPTARITETLSPPSATYQAWQTSQLVAIRSALHEALGR